MPSPDVSIVVPVFNEERSLPELVSRDRRGDDALCRRATRWCSSTTARPTAAAPCCASSPARDSTAARRGDVAQQRSVGGARRRFPARARAPAWSRSTPICRTIPPTSRRLLAALDGVAVVSGVRRNRRDDWLRRVSSRIANGVRRSVLDDGVTDVGCSLKAYRARVPAAHPGVQRLSPLPSRADSDGRRKRARGRRHPSAARSRHQQVRRSATGCGAAWSISSACAG